MTLYINESVHTMDPMQTKRMSKLLVTLEEGIWENLTRLSLGTGPGAGRGVEEGFTVFLSSSLNFDPWTATSSNKKQTNKQNSKRGEETLSLIVTGSLGFAGKTTAKTLPAWRWCF